MVHNRRREGRVQQETLASFGSEAELRAVLEGGWADWKRAMRWRFPELRWNWARTKGRLEEALDGWEDARGAGRRQRTASDLAGAAAAAMHEHLARMTTARPEDAAAIEDNDEVLRAIRAELDRLLGPEAPERRGETMYAGFEDRRTEAERLFDDGMEDWWAGDRRAACRLLRRVLKADPRHVDARVHLAIDAESRSRLKEGERLLDEAIELGRRDLHYEGDLVEWGWLENRPWLRALGNRALLHGRRGQWEESLRIHREMLRLNPGDNQGARWLVGEDLHRLGRLEEAVEAYEGAWEQPDCRFGVALALFALGRRGHAAMALLHGIGENLYIVPVLLGERYERVDGWHGINWREPAWAADYADRYGDLWRKQKGAAKWLRDWWRAEPVRRWRGELADAMREVDGLAAGTEERTAALWRRQQLGSEEHIRGVVEAVEPGAADVPLPTGRGTPILGTDDVRIRREGEYAIFEYLGSKADSLALRVGGDLAATTDDQLLETHNAIAREQRKMRDSFEYKAKEVPMGRPQIQRSQHGGWEMRGDVLRCGLEWSKEDETVVPQIDGRTLSWAELSRMLQTYEGWGMRLVIVPDDELGAPEIVVGEDRSD